MSSAASGKCAGAEALVLLRPGGAALTGLRVSSCLRTGSPDKARRAPPPGNAPGLRHWRCFVPVALR
ncbi:hypothetical protein DA718_00300 [Klebsiella huaxiensis]|uniref:hypothetical protein n=1 Tax=Klebsiella huaxiensis TaxID=2153354 RepID=UPI00102F18B6|nr:hypothetical protein [Klebsiella huaxiensis]QBG05722.1 hypothetical protein DA718_00300 [Klebsiella huaxiensis]